MYAYQLQGSLRCELAGSQGTLAEAVEVLPAGYLSRHRHLVSMAER